MVPHHHQGSFGIKSMTTRLRVGFDSFHEESPFPHLLDFQRSYLPLSSENCYPKVQGSKLFGANFRNASTHLPAINNDSSLIHEFFSRKFSVLADLQKSYPYAWSLFRPTKVSYLEV